MFWSYVCWDGKSELECWLGQIMFWSAAEGLGECCSVDWGQVMLWSAVERSWNFSANSERACQAMKNCTQDQAMRLLPTAEIFKYMFSMLWKPSENETSRCIYQYYRYEKGFQESNFRFKSCGLSFCVRDNRD